MTLQRTLVVLALGLSAATSASAQATQSVSFQVDAINQIAFTGGPSLVVSSAAAGAEPTSVTAVVSWGVTTNQGNSKITGSMNATLPAGVMLSVDLVAPGGATSAGSQPLGTTAVDLVTGLTRVAQSGLGVTYTLSATAAAGVVPSTTRTVTFTITGGT